MRLFLQKDTHRIRWFEERIMEVTHLHIKEWWRLLLVGARKAALMVQRLSRFSHTRVLLLAPKPWEHLSVMSRWINNSKAQQWNRIMDSDNLLSARRSVRPFAQEMPYQGLSGTDNKMSIPDSQRYRYRWHLGLQRTSCKLGRDLEGKGKISGGHKHTAPGHPWVHHWGIKGGGNTFRMCL